MNISGIANVLMVFTSFKIKKEELKKRNFKKTFFFTLPLTFIILISNRM